MATYAPNGSVGNSDTTYLFSNGRSPNRYHLMRILRKRGMREVGEIISTLLTDSTPATSAGVTTTQVDSIATPGGTNSQGGVRTTTANETVGLTLDSTAAAASANTARAVATADVTALQLELIPTGNRALRAPSVTGTITYPADASGNGGGGKLS